MLKLIGWTLDSIFSKYWFTLLVLFEGRGADIASITFVTFKLA